MKTKPEIETNLMVKRNVMQNKPGMKRNLTFSTVGAGTSTTCVRGVAAWSWTAGTVMTAPPSFTTVTPSRGRFALAM